MPESQDNPSAIDAMSDRPAGPAPGKLRVEHKTVDQFTEEQRSALTQGNTERTIKGLPSWLVADFVRANPGKFPDVDFELDHAEHKARAEAAPAPSNATRVDQRPVR